MTPPPGWTVESFDMDCYKGHIDWTPAYCDKLLIFRKGGATIMTFLELKKGQWQRSVPGQLAGCNEILRLHFSGHVTKKVFCHIGKGINFIKGPITYPKVAGTEIIHFNPSDDLVGKLERIGVLR